MFEPNFKISEKLSNLLASIDAHQITISQLTITPIALKALQESARLISTHCSTQIEGNLLIESEVRSASRGAMFPNRSRDTTEVKNYFNALDFLNELTADKTADIREDDIRSLNDLLTTGLQKPDSYRDGQNVIRDRRSGEAVKGSAKSLDTPSAMADLFTWINAGLKTKTVPLPIIAALAHYQISTLHPYEDGNGHTARLLANLILQRSEYGVGGIIALESYYAADPTTYYDALTVDASHSFFFGQETADLSEWLEYFCDGMVDSFTIAEKKAKAVFAQKPPENKKQLRRHLERRQEKVLSLFRKHKFVTTFEISELFNIHRRTSLNICNKWVEEGFLIQHGKAKKSRKYELADRWLSLI